MGPSTKSSSSEFDPSSPSAESSDTSGSHDRPPTQEPEQKSCHQEPKYIVFRSCLETLVRWCHCPSCGGLDVRPSWTTYGTQLTITLVCDSCDAGNKWKSQPNLGSFAAGNLLLSAGILFAGASVAKVLRVLNSIGVVTYNRRTFFNHQKEILHPVIQQVWKSQQRAHLTLLQVEGRALVLGGDGRADSPGHSAKFGTYTTMELEANVVLDLQLVQVSL